MLKPMNESGRGFDPTIPQKSKLRRTIEAAGLAASLTAAAVGGIKSLGGNSEAQAATRAEMKQKKSNKEIPTAVVSQKPDAGLIELFSRVPFGGQEDAETAAPSELEHGEQNEDDGGIDAAEAIKLAEKKIRAVDLKTKMEARFPNLKFSFSQNNDSLRAHFFNADGSVELASLCSIRFSKLGDVDIVEIGSGTGIDAGQKVAENNLDSIYSMLTDKKNIYLDTKRMPDSQTRAYLIAKGIPTNPPLTSG